MFRSNPVKKLTDLLGGGLRRTNIDRETGRDLAVITQGRR
jgi:hypothetical protein